MSKQNLDNLENLPGLESLQEIYLPSDEQNFFVGIPCGEIGAWTLYEIYDEAGNGPSIYFFQTQQIDEIIKDTEYLDYIRFAIRRKNSSCRNHLQEQIARLLGKSSIAEVLAEKPIFGIGENKDGDRYIGKKVKITEQTLTLQEFDFDTCQLDSEELDFPLDEIEYIEFLGDRTELMTAYLESKTARGCL